MIKVDRQTFAAVWRLGALLLGAGWVLYAFLGRDSQVFLVVMIVLSMLVGSGITAVFRRRPDA